MSTKDFTTSFQIVQTSKQVFDAVNHISGWWSEEIEGSTDQPQAEFNYHYEDVHRSKMKIIEFLPNQKIVWLVLDNYFKFTKDKSEWKGTKIIFETDEKENSTLLRFTHLGLVPQYECFEICRDAWTNYLQNSLRSLITTAKGMPNGKDKPKTENEKKLR